MKTIYLKSKPLFKGRKPMFNIKITEKNALDIAPDAINVIDFDDESEYYKYISDSMKKDFLPYEHSTKQEFDEAFIEVVSKINNISNL